MIEIEPDIINELKKVGVRGEFLQTLLGYLEGHPHFHDVFVSFLNEPKSPVFEFVSRYHKLPAHILVRSFFNDLRKSKKTPQLIREDIQSRLSRVLGSDLDLLTLRVFQQGGEEAFERLFSVLQEYITWSQGRGVQGYFDTLKRDVIRYLLQSETGNLSIEFLEQLNHLAMTGHLKVEDLRLFGMTVLSKESVTILRFLQNQSPILKSRTNTSIYFETFSSYFLDEEKGCDVPEQVQFIPGLIEQLVLPDYLSQPVLSEFLDEISVSLELITRFKNQASVKKVLMLIGSYRNFSTDLKVNQFIRAFFMDLFLYCKQEDLDWACDKFNHSVAKNFLRKLVASYYDRVESFFYLVKFYFLFEPPYKSWKPKNNRDFLDWFLGMGWSEKMEVMLDVTGILTRQIQSTYLVGLFVYLVTQHQNLYMFLLRRSKIMTLQPIPRPEYLRQARTVLRTLVAMLRNITLSVLGNDQKLVQLKDPRIREILSLAYSLNFEDMAYESFYMTSSDEQLEAYQSHVKRVALKKKEDARLRDFSYDYYVVSFREAKSYVDPIVAELLGPITILPSDKPYSNSKVLYLPRSIGQFYDQKEEDLSSNRNLILYQALAVHECCLFLGNSRFLNRSELPEDFDYPGLFLEIYWIVENFRTETIFKEKYLEVYSQYCELLNTLHLQKAKQFEVKEQGIQSLLNLLSIYMHCDEFPAVLLQNEQNRKLLWKKLDEQGNTVANWIKQTSLMFHSIDFKDPQSSIDESFRFYDEIVEMLSRKEQEESLESIGLDQKEYLNLLVGDPKLKGKGRKDMELEVGSIENLESIYSELHHFIEEEDPEKLLDNFYQFFGEFDKYEQDPVRGQNHQIYEEIGTTTRWQDMLDIIDAYKN